MGTGNRHPTDRPGRPTDPADGFASAGGVPPAPVGEHPVLHRSGYIGTLTAGPAKKRPKITHGEHPRGYQRPDDAILADIAERLSERPDIDAGNVRTTVAAGIIRLTGEVRSERQKRRIGDCIGNVTGVVRVENELSVKR